MYTSGSTVNVNVVIPKTNSILDTGVVSLIVTYPNKMQLEVSSITGLVRRVAPTSNSSGTDGSFSYNLNLNQGAGLYTLEFRKSEDSDTNNTGDTVIKKVLIQAIAAKTTYTTVL